MRVLDTFVTAGLVLSSSFADARAPIARKLPPTKSQSEEASIGTPKYFNFTMPVDHFTSSDTRTYENEYWVNDTYYKQGSPVFVFDLGETGSTAEDAAGWISDEDTMFARLLERYNGLGIAWQHRFYGYSLPFPLDKNGVPIGGVKAFQYLTQEQAMEDVVYFANNIEATQMKLKIDGKDALHPDQVPWIFVGGSYPGMRAALLRVRNPSTIYASWAASAPLQPDADGSAYYNAALRSLYPNCTSDFHLTVKWMDRMFDTNNNTAINFLKERIWLANALAGNISMTLDSTAAANQSFSDMAQFMQAPLDLDDFMHNGPTGVRLFCDYMETYDVGNAKAKTTVDNYDVTLADKKIAKNAGLFSTYGPERTLDAFLAAYVWVANPNFKHMNPKDSDSSDTPDMDDIQTWGAISWAWQNLYELGNFVGWSPDYEKFHPNDGILSKYYTWQDNRDSQIAQLIGVKPSDVPEVTSYWAEYGGWGMQPSNTMFADGEWDPWRAFSPGSEEYEMGKPVRNYTTEMPKCGQRLDGTKLFGEYYTGLTAAHCSDMGSMSNARVSRSLNLFTHALDAWLPCFHADD